MEFTVKRSQWLRGEGDAESMLLRERDKKMCCLGFLALACGYTPGEIVAVRNPAQLTDVEKMPEELFVGNDVSTECGELMNINDCVIQYGEPMIEKDREADLTDAFEAIGITVKFVD